MTGERNALVRVQLPAKKAKTEDKSGAKRPRGRPSKYTPELAEEICRRYAGGETLIEICEDDHVPSEWTVRGWIWDEENGRDTPSDGFAAAFARAREMYIHRKMEEIDLEARRARIGVTRKRKKGVSGEGIVDTEELIESDNVARSNLRISANQFIVDRIGWKVYGRRAPKEEVEPSPEGEGDRLIIEGGLPDDVDEPPPAPPETDLGDGAPPVD